MMNDLPSITVTFLFTDIEGSTKLAQEYQDAMPALLARHNQILHQAIEGHSRRAYNDGRAGDCSCTGGISGS